MLRSPLRVSDDHLRFGGWGVHYAWIIVLLAATMWMISSSFRFAAVVLVPHLQDPVDGFGWSKWAIAIAFSLQWVISAVMSPVLGGLGERYGVRPILVLGAVLFLAGMVLCGYMTSLWQFYLYFGILLGIAMTVFQVPLVSSVTVWFRTNLGAAMGGMQALQSLGTVTMIPLIAVLFAGVGLNWTFWIPGIAGGILLFLMIPPFFNEPAQAKMRAYGPPSGNLLCQCSGMRRPRYGTKSFSERHVAPMPSGTSSAFTSGGAWATTSSSYFWSPWPKTSECQRAWPSPHSSLSSPPA